jgi:predicted MPP superfamily phosphohydrolase
MLSVETVPYADRADGTGRQLGGPTGGLLKRLVWRTANCCLLGGLLTWPLERDWVRVETLPMPLVNLGWEFDGVRLVHLSDLHCGALVREKHLRRYVEMVNSLDADFVAITGDFITTGSRRHARAVARALRDMRANRAVVACLGNHDYGRWHPRGWGEAAGIADFLSGELSDAGVIVLRNESRTFFHGESVLQFVGVEDYWSPRYDPQTAFDLVDFDSPVITLAHNPDTAPDLAAIGAGWVLSGHTHGKATPDTRFWDVVYPTRFKQFVGGQYALGGERHLYVNRGISNAWRVRSEHRPEITLFTLRAVLRRERPSRVPFGQSRRSPVVVVEQPAQPALA